MKFPPSISITSFDSRLISMLMVGVFLGVPARAVVFYETADPFYNSTAPSAAYEDSGWQFQGLFGGFLGTMISPQLFITATHVGVQSSTFVSSAAFNGTADVTYTIDAAANGGAGYWDIAGTDLRIYKVNEVFTSYAELYSGSDELGRSLVTIGRGGPRGAEVTIGADLKGWETGGSDGITRWGTNQVSNVVSSGVGDLLVAEFDAITTAHEAFLASGDSGGGLFIKVGATWKLAGINYAIDGSFDTNNIVGDGSEFTGALFDIGGLYAGSDAAGWTLVPDQPTDLPQQLYASRISSNASAINAVIQSVPEPSGLALLFAAAGLTFRRKRSFEKAT